MPLVVCYDGLVVGAYSSSPEEKLVNKTNVTFFPNLRLNCVIQQSFSKKWLKQGVISIKIYY